MWIPRKTYSVCERPGADFRCCFHFTLWQRCGTRTVAIPSAVHWLQPTLSCDRVLLKHTESCLKPCVKHTEKKQNTAIISAPTYVIPLKTPPILFVTVLLHCFHCFPLYLMYPHHTYTCSFLFVINHTHFPPQFSTIVSFPRSGRYRC